MKQVVVLLLTIFCLTFNVYSQDFSVSSSTLPVANFSRTRIWDITERSLLGIRARDPINELLETTHTEAFTLQTKSKQNCAGLLNRYGTEGEDHGDDWNLMMKLLDDFHFLYDVALVHYTRTNLSFVDPSDGSKWFKCIEDGKDCDAKNFTHDPCMFAEIDPDHNFYSNNEWFDANTRDHCEQGKFLMKNDTFGVYGPFVMDANHGQNPEIHPAQQIWFRNKETSTVTKKAYWMMFIQDASDRFGNWVRSPIYGQFLIGFKMKPAIHSSAPLTVNIRIAEKKDLVSKNFPQQNADCDDGTSHSLVIDGNKLITVNELSSDDDLGIQFTELCRLSTGEIQGYIQISMVLGDYNTNEIGVCVLDTEVTRSQFIIAQPVAQPVIRQ